MDECRPIDCRGQLQRIGLADGRPPVGVTDLLVEVVDGAAQLAVDFEGEGVGGRGRAPLQRAHLDGIGHRRRVGRPSLRRLLAQRVVVLQRHLVETTAAA